MSQLPSNSFLDDDPFFADLLASPPDIDEEILVLKEALDSDRCAKEKLDEIQNFLSSSNVKSVTSDVVEEKVLSLTLVSGAQKLYFEVIKSIDEKLKVKRGNEDDIRSQLDLVIGLFKCWDACMSHIKTLEKISIVCVQSLPMSLLEVTVNALNHCKTSSENYGDYFHALSDTVTAVFRGCVTTLNSFYALMDTSITFDQNQRDEMNILLKIIDETGKIATLSGDMDAKTLTEMWKQFAKWSTNYCLAMKELSPSTVTFHFKGLSEGILTRLSSVNLNKQKSLNERSILCSRFLLKILEKLSSVYCGWIRNEIMAEMIVMLTSLFRYTEQYLKMTNYTADFVKFVVSNFAFMIDPFVAVVLKSDSFKVAFFEYAKNVDKECLGYHMLTLTVIKKLSTDAYESQQEWCTKENSILDVCFQNIDKLSKDICIGQLKIQTSRVSTESYLANIYEATCLNIYSLVCQVRSSDFNSTLVPIILKYLMGGKYYSALLSSDVWSFICRLCCANMCYTSFKYLWRVYESYEQREHHLNIVILFNLLCRQFQFLSDNDKTNFVSGITNTSMKSHQWRLIDRMLDSKRKEQVRQQIDAASVNNRISVDLKNLEDQPSIRNMDVLIKDLSIIEAFKIQQDERSIDTFTKMWQKIVHLLGDCEGPPLRVMENLAIAVLRATNPPQGDTKYMTMVLQSMVSLYPYASSELHLEFCRLLKRCGKQLTEANASVIADLYTRLLCDPKPFIQQQALESFNYLANFCPGSFLSSTATNIMNAKTEASKILPAYIENNNVHKIVGFANEAELFEVLCGLDERHVCRKRNSVEREEKFFKVDDDVDVDRRVERVCKDMEQLVKLKAQIGRDGCDRLRRVCQTFLNGDR